VIELRSDLGGGKTTLVRGVARGARSQDAVGSPSFTISREYACPEFVIHHYDFYRLAEPGIMADELYDVMSNDQAVVIVEWPDVAEQVLPADRVLLQIAVSGDNSRDITITLPESRQYLREENI
jgi:tRNA threonylcarbamoyladenosine biosynthesis protein TsaE